MEPHPDILPDLTASCLGSKRQVLRRHARQPQALVLCEKYHTAYATLSKDGLFWGVSLDVWPLLLWLTVTFFWQNPKDATDVYFVGVQCAE